jgi:hypothetical protein
MTDGSTAGAVIDERNFFSRAEYPVQYAILTIRELLRWLPENVSGVFFLCVDMARTALGNAAIR